MSVPAHPASSGQAHAPLKYLFPGWFAIVMGLGGLSLAWHRAVPVMGEGAELAAGLIGAIAAAVFAVVGLRMSSGTPRAAPPSPP